MKENEQLSLAEYFDVDEHTPANSTSVHTIEYPVFNFDSIFEDKRFKEVHNQHSMTILGDSLDVLKQMKEKSISLIFADAPYGIGKDFGNDSDKWESVKAYTDWCKLWIDECMRVLRDDGTMYFMTATQHMPYLDIYASEKYNVLCRIVWTYDSSGVQAKKIYGSLYEPILMICKSSKSKYTFNYSDILVEAKTGAKRKLIDYRKNPPQPYNTEKVPGNVWNFCRVRFKMEEYENHPTQKPLSICDRIIKVHSNENDLIYIPFAGSGSEIESCIRNNRNYIATEINREYIDEIILPRISSI